MYTVKDVAKKLEVSEHTIRFWAKSGFFPFVKRNNNNIRLLRSVGIDNKSIKRYIELCIKGDSTIKERYDIIKKTKEKAQEQMSELENQLNLLNFKENYYVELIKNNSKDTWNPMNKN